MGAARTLGSERFALLRPIGVGGMGAVYEALDARGGRRVALKTLTHLDAAALYRFKNEFRALADLAHPNVIALYELLSDRDQWFFTMELVEGVDFLRHVRFGAAATEAPTEIAPISAITESTPSARDAPDGSFDEVSLRAALTGLCRGVAALHGAGKLHRDLKPSNVLVTREGRVVVLDFGLVSELEQGSVMTTRAEIAGTAEYMSPEQAAATELTEASDWYAVGVMLYEALTGILPFRGPRMQILIDKQRAEPPRPRELVAGLPPDLEQLCVELLRIAPDQRPRGDAILSRISAGRAASLVPQAPPFVGRASHLAALEASLDLVREGRAARVLIEGPSGMGKTVLVRRFLESLGDELVLTSRCYERESVPFKAFDSVIDALSRFLMRTDNVGAYLPPDVLALARVFPVLRRVEAIARHPKTSHEAPDPQELRARAFGALREMFRRIAEHKKIVVWIDDLQWGDIDSGALVGELLRGDGPPAMLFITTYRSEEAGSEAVAAFHVRGVPSRVIHLLALQRDDAVELAQSLLRSTSGDPALAEPIADVAGGSPFLVDALVRWAATGAGLRRSSSAMRVEEAVRGRIADLEPDALRLLEAISVAGHPISREIAMATAQLGEVEARAALAVLRNGNLVRTASHDELEPAHDKIRETLTLDLADDVARDIHARLASGLEAAGEAPETLAVHFFRGGDRPRAAHYSSVAARAAADALAFERAATLYSDAIELGADDPDALRARLGDALSNCGRGVEAAEAYLAAATNAPEREALELRRRAAEQLLRSGHFDAGLKTLHEVLAAVGMKLPRTPNRALAALLLRSAQLAIRGYDFRPCDASAEQLAQIDVCWSSTLGLSIVDNIRGMAFQKRGMLLALRAGDPFRIARALSGEIPASAVDGSRAFRRTEALIARTKALVDQIDDPYLDALFSMTRGVAAFLQLNWPLAREASMEAVRIFRARCTGVAWELASAHLFTLWSLWSLGEIAELGRRVPALSREARDRGDLYLATMLRVGLCNSLWLFADDVTTARSEVEEAMAEWSQGGVHLQHYQRVQALTAADLYAGDGSAALARINETYGSFRSAFLFRIQNLRVDGVIGRARATLSVSAAAADPAPLLRAALKDAARLDAERLPCGNAPAAMIRGTVAHARGNDELAVSHLRDAIAKLDSDHMALWAAATRHRLGQLLSGDEGRALVADGDAFMAAQGIVRPEQVTEMILPGFFPRKRLT